MKERCDIVLNGEFIEAPIAFHLYELPAAHFDRLDSLLDDTFDVVRVIGESGHFHFRIDLGHGSVAVRPWPIRARSASHPWLMACVVTPESNNPLRWLAAIHTHRRFRRALAPFGLRKMDRDEGGQDRALECVS